MKWTLSALLSLGCLCGLVSIGGADTEVDRLRNESLRFQGLWLLQSLEDDGKSVPVADSKDRSVFFRANNFLRRDAEGNLLQAGEHRLHADRSDALDWTILQGDKRGDTLLGIYEMKGDTLKVCFDRTGKNRPNEFKTTPDSKRFLAVYKRARPLDEPFITGSYNCEGIEANGKAYKAQVEIEKLGDSYQVRWLTPQGKPMHVGAGIRKGNILSVTFLSPQGVGNAVYQLSKDGKLMGEWTDTGRLEIVPNKEGQPVSTWTQLGGLGLVRTEVLTPK